MIDATATMTDERPFTVADLRRRLRTTAIAFRGYNVTNTGLTCDLLSHPRFGPIVERHVLAAQAVAEDVLARPVDLLEIARGRTPATLETYAENLALVVGVEQAHVAILSDLLEEPLSGARLSFGYSLGEVSALIATGLFSLEAGLGMVLALADDTAALAHDVTMGVLFSRGPALPLPAVERACIEITARGKGMLTVSSILSPNTVLLLGQGETVRTFKKECGKLFPTKVYVKLNEHRWPPVHTPITWLRNIPNRAGVMLAGAEGGFGNAARNVLSCVTGDFGYNEWNARKLLMNWVDHPQRLWSVIEHTLESDVDTIVHIGPEPNIVPATFGRLAQNVAAQLAAPTWAAFGLRTMSRFVNRQWLARLISREAYLLRAPTLRHVVLEDWLLGLDV